MDSGTVDPGWSAFADPDAWHRPAAYWFWQQVPSHEQVRRQVAQLHAAGYRSFQVQSRMGLPLADHLGPAWLSALSLAVEEAAARGMVVGLYDDYNWQSGHAAGRAVADGHDAHRERHLFWSCGQVREGTLELTVSGIRASTEGLGPAAMAWHFEQGQVRWGDWEVVAAFAGNADSGVRDVTAAVQLPTGSGTGCALRVQLPEADGEQVTVLVAARCTTSRLTNAMDPAAVERSPRRRTGPCSTPSARTWAGRSPTCSSTSRTPTTTAGPSTPASSRTPCRTAPPSTTG